MESIRLSPHRFRLRLDAGDGVENDDSTIQDTERALDLKGEINVTRSINQIDEVLLPLERNGSCVDGDASFSFLRHPIHYGVARVNGTNGSCKRVTSVVEHSLSHGSFSGIDVSENANVPDSSLHFGEIGGRGMGERGNKRVRVERDVYNKVLNTVR